MIIKHLIIILLFLAIRIPGAFAQVESPMTLVCSAGDYTVCPCQSPAEQVMLPIMVTNCYNLGAVSLVINFKNTALHYENYYNPSDDLTPGFLLINCPMPFNSVYMTWYSPTPVNIGTDTLISFRFSVLCDTTTIAFDISSCSFVDISGYVMPCTYQDGATIDDTINILQQPNDVIIAPDSSTHFICRTSLLSGNTVYEWQVKQSSSSPWTPLINSYNYQNVNDDTLIVLHPQPSMNNYSYRCRIMGCNNTVYSDSAVLSICLPPLLYSIITPQPANGHYCLGNPGVQLGIDGSQNGYQYTLLFNGQGIPGFTEVSGTGLPLPFGTFSTPGVYSIEASTITGACNTLMNGIVNVVADTPVIGYTDPDQYISPGDTATLQVYAYLGSGYYHYLWSNGDTTSFIMVSPQFTTSYSVTVSDIAGCNAVDQVTVVVDSIPFSNSSIEGILTYDNNLQTPLGNTQIKLKLGNTIVNQVNTDVFGHFSFTNLPPGIYYLEAIPTTVFGGINASDGLKILKILPDMSYCLSCP